MGSGLALLFAVGLFAAGNLATVGVGASAGYMAARAILGAFAAGPGKLVPTNALSWVYGCTHAVYSSAFTVALWGLPAAWPPVALALTPTLLLALSPRRTPASWVTVGLFAAGSVALVAGSGKPATWWGVLALLVAVAGYCARLLLAERAVALIQPAASVRLAALLVAAATCWWLPGWLASSLSWPVLAAVVVTGAGGAVGQRAILAAARKLPAWVLASSNVGTAALTAGAGAVLLSQPLAASGWVGMAVVVAGGALAARAARPARDLLVTSSDAGTSF